MTRNRKNLNISELIGFSLGIVVLAVLVVSFQAWLLGLVLSWFGITLGFWKSVVVVILIGMLFGGSRSISK
jgi:hypothetical protein